MQTMTDKNLEALVLSLGLNKPLLKYLQRQRFLGAFYAHSYLHKRHMANM
jgi:hypothetical protein